MSDEYWAKAMHFVLSNYDDELEENLAQIITDMRDNAFGYEADLLLAEHRTQQERRLFMCNTDPTEME